LDAISELLPPLIRGAAVTVGLTLISGFLGIVIAFGVGLSRESRLRPIRWILAGYVQIFRGTSGLVQLFVFFYVLPSVGLFLPALVAGITALALNTGAYGSEIVRAGVAAVDPGQHDAAVALNMPSRVAMRRIILPQAVVQMIPPFANLSVELLKGTALVSLIAITELTFAGRQVIAAGGNATQVYALVLTLYFLLAIPIARSGAFLEGRLVRRMRLGRPT
jgi:polar amino acid transport system permease protein